ncbi:MAG: hypothetical protein AAGG38_14310 [Planctomycetota bacterium]
MKRYLMTLIAAGSAAVFSLTFSAPAPAADTACVTACGCSACGGKACPCK